LIASISSVAEQMRHCANVADQFAQMLTQNPLGTNMAASLGAVYAGSKRGTEEEDIEGGNKKRRTNRKTRDPDAPKRAASSYIFFQNDLRPELRKQHPDISTADILGRVKKQWAEMTPEQKAPYERLQAEAKHKWETEKRAYDERRGIVAPTKPVNRKTTAAIIEEPVQPATVGLPVLPQKTPESSDSSADTNLSDKSEEEEDGTAGDSGDEEEEEPAPSPPLSKSKAKRK
ncbi:high mobility group box domain-containing protein, partial [Russula emetica]